MKIAIMACLTALSTTPGVPVMQAGDPNLPTAKPIFSIINDDCVSVDADGEPWSECGFQAYAMNEDGSRVLTVSSAGLVQLWDGNGRELRRIDWPDQPSGASGYPDGRAVIAGKFGVVVVHQNQVLVIDLTSGEALAQRVVDAMMVEDLRKVGRDRVFAAIKARDWSGGAREITLPGGELVEVPGLTDLMRLGPSYWMAGSRPPFTLHRIGGVPATRSSERSCMPLDEDYCVWRDMPGDAIHVLDVTSSVWRSFPVGRVLSGTDIVDVVRSGATFYAVICSPPSSGESQQDGRCVVRDLAAERELHSFQGKHARAVGVPDPARPGVRMTISIGNRQENYLIAADGSTQLIDATGHTSLLAPTGGMILPAKVKGTSILTDVAGRAVAGLPFTSYSCGNGWPSWLAACPVSSNGWRWLVPSNDEPEERQPNSKVRLTLYDVPPTSGLSRATAH